MKIKVKFVPSHYEVLQWWFKANRSGVYGIAEWRRLND